MFTDYRANEPDLITMQEEADIAKMEACKANGCTKSH